MNNYYQDLTKLPQMKKTETSHKVDKGIIKDKKCCTIYIPLKFVAMMNLIHQNLEDKNDEFTVFFRTEVDNEDSMVYYIVEDYVDYKKSYIIPEQIVTSAHFTNKEDINFNKFNSCIHRHPQGVTKFSGTDEQWLNDNVEVSVLFIPASKTNKNVFPHAIVNLPLANGKKIQVEAECIIEDDIFYEEEREVIYNKLKKYINEEYITEDIEITVPEDYSDKVIVDIPLDINDTMTLKVDYDLFTKKEREDIINDVKKYIKHDVSFDRQRTISTYPRQQGKMDRVNRFFSDAKFNTEQLNKDLDDPSYFDLREKSTDPFYYNDSPYINF